MTIPELLAAFGAGIRAQAGAIALYAGGSLATGDYRPGQRRDGQTVPVSPGYRLRRAADVHQLMSDGIQAVLTL